MKSSVNICWFRRDLRLQDNTALYHALKAGKPVVPLFIFDKNILDELQDPADRRVEFIHCALLSMQSQLEGISSTLEVRYGKPEEIFSQLLNDYSVEAVFTNRDYEPYALRRDKLIADILGKEGVSFHSYKDQVIFEKSEVLKGDGKPYTVFTPYSRKWKSKLNNFYLQSYDCEKYFLHFFQDSPKVIPSLESMGFRPGHTKFPSGKWGSKVLEDYEKQRDFPGIENGTTRIGVHLRFGTVSIRKLAREAEKMSPTYLNELIWRDFFQTILWHFPEVVTSSFRPQYDKIKWRNNEEEFKAWCQGLTGYPIVDAGMRELNQTGFMHNRVRMITASFLCKHLLIDWRLGEAYFAEKLLDYDLAANNGNWQWAAGCGCDAVPYFRIFNPYIQTKKFDPDLKYVKKWFPEFEGLSYPRPIVEHDVARERCLRVYKTALIAK